MPTELPRCCGRSMQVRMETPRFLEVWCGACQDVAYLKKTTVPPPDLLDD